MYLVLSSSFVSLAVTPSEWLFFSSCLHLFNASSCFGLEEGEFPRAVNCWLNALFHFCQDLKSSSWEDVFKLFLICLYWTCVLSHFYPIDFSFSFGSIFQNLLFMHTLICIVRGMVISPLYFTVFFPNPCNFSEMILLFFFFPHFAKILSSIELWPSPRGYFLEILLPLCFRLSFKTYWRTNFLT